ncbi:hypothetical protein BUALT_Bualt02G0005600 [Buddleja alternifolia]|uniref:Uncharacterized protein n=1 Tax=Buddleja alternifolia TaxID=168488 RepID=A0AAV6Y329_9LAMI|nr:hypothetical protein BUALT_Bualt02G0005600 [Buddleja alternifolia]
MHGCSSASVLVVNAEVDSMGGVVEGGVGIANKTSPRKAAIDKVQAELRQEYDVREERKRELEFLEKGGDPLEFKLGNAASVSVQSTSFTDQHPDQFVNSEAKGSVAFTASPHGDSVESSGRPGPRPCEPNTADNLMLFDAENESSEVDRNLLHPGRSKIVPSEQSSQMDGSHKTREHGDSTAFNLPRKAYKRRNRSRLNRDGARSSSTDVNPTRGSHGSSVPSRYGLGDVKGLASGAEDLNISLNWSSKPTSPIDDTLHNKTIFVDGPHDMELDGLKSAESTKDSVKGVSIAAESDAIASKNPDEQLHQESDSGAAKTPTQMDGPEATVMMEEMTSAVIECQPSVTATKAENQFSSCQVNDFSGKKGDEVTNDAHNSSASRGIKGLDSELSSNQTCVSNDGNNDNAICAIRNVDSNGNVKDQSLVPDVTPVIESDKFVQEKKDTEGIDSSTRVDKESTSACQSELENGLALPEEELNRSVSASENEVKDQLIIEGMEASSPTGSESGRKLTNPVNPCPNNEASCDVRNQETSIPDLPEVGLLTRVSTVTLEAQTSSGPELKLARKLDEDSILKEAEIIEAKRKRIAELSVGTSPTEIRRKSHWDYVLEEMAWLANDFAQERIWKVASAAQISYRAAFACRLRKQEKSSHVDAKKVSHTLMKAVMEFWHSIEVQIQETSKELDQQSRKDGRPSVQAYAVRFLKYNKPSIFHSQDQVPLTPERISDSGILDLSWEDNLTEENLFYTVPLGAMETYRKSIESHVAQCERIGSCMQEGVETSACDAAADLESHYNAYDEEEGETSTYNMSVAFEGSKSSSFGQQRRKYLTHAYGSRSYEIGPDLLPMQCADNKVVTQQSSLRAKRPGSSLNVSIPTKRVRTASRRVISPFNAGASGYIQMPNKTDASSGDTNSFQDDQSTLRGGLLVPNSLEVESVGDFDKQLPFDSAEVSTKPKKKKKAKHLNAAYEHKWQADSSFQNEQFQKDHLKKRYESHQFESNGNSGFLSQPILKKPKIMRQLQDNSYDNIPPTGGSVPSPVASQMSNMSNPNKIIKMLGGRDRGRKAKALKMPSGQPGSGSAWSLFEDQALVVLAHDLGPNWELVSDAMNSTLHFKCIFRKAKECKERHNFLMDRTSGDGADSAEDSGSSQPYPSTLPGIPKGSARQLFQRLQGPMEEDTLKSHFEKIIIIGQKQLYRKTQMFLFSLWLKGFLAIGSSITYADTEILHTPSPERLSLLGGGIVIGVMHSTCNYDLIFVIKDSKQLQQPHSSHTIALSQVCPNNLNGGLVLTPLELCDASIPGPDILSLGYHGPHSSGLAIPNQGSVNPMLPSSGTSPAFQGSPNMMIGNNLSSSPGPLNSSVREGRYMVPRSAPLSADEQQRMQQYSQMIPGRGIPQPNISAAGALPGPDRGVRILPGGNGMVSGVNRSLPMARPGFQGIAPSPMVNSGSMGMSSANMHSGVGAGQGSSMLRPREALHMMRKNSFRSKWVLPSCIEAWLSRINVPEFQMPGNGQGASHFGGLGSPPVSSYPLHHQPSHPISPQPPQVLTPHHSHFQGPANHSPANPQQQAYAIRWAKERNRFLQQQQFSTSNSLTPQPQLPISSPLQNSPQATSPPVSLSPPKQKQQTPTQGVVRNTQSGGSGLTNQTGKQRQRQQQQQQFSQANRQQHPQQRQQVQAQQQAKGAKGVARGNMINQNVPNDSSLSNGVSTNPVNHFQDKTEPATHMIQSQGLYTAAQPTRQNVASQSSNHSLPQQKKYSVQAASSSKHPQVNSHSDNISQGHIPSTGRQSVPSLAVAGPNHQQAPPQQKLVNQNQPALQRVAQPNRQINSDPSTKPQVRDSDTDQHPTSSSTEMDTMTTLPQASNNASNVGQVVSQASGHQWTPSEQLLDSNALNSATPNSSESLPQVSQGLGQRLSPASLPSSRHDVGAQWQQKQHSQLQQPQQQAKLLQAGNGNLYGRSSDPRLE